MKKNNFILWFLFLGLFLLFFLPPTDPDLGWQLRCGYQIWTQGKICRENQFSLLLANYPTNYPVGYQFLIYPFFRLSSLFGLSFLNGLLMTASFYFFLKLSGNKNLKIVLLPLLIFLSWTVFGFGLRSQLLGFFYFVLILFLIDKNRFWFIPLVILLWVNSHGSFILGLVLFGFSLIQETFSLMAKKINFKKYVSLWLLFLTSILGSLFNPSGPKIYLEAWRHFHVVQLNKLIAEWTPPSLPFKIIILLSAGLSLLFLAKFKKQKLRLFKLLVFIALTILAFQARRNLPFFFLFSAWILSFPGFKKDFQFFALFTSMVIFVFGFFLQFPRTILIDSNFQRFYESGSVKYAQGAVEFLKNQQEKGPPAGEASNIFNTYEQGGFLIWQLPEYKVFVDGRMPAWETSSGKSPYTIYLETLQTQPGWQETLKEYNISWLLIGPGTFMDLLLQPNPEKFGWQEVYRDKIAAVYKKI